MVFDLLGWALGYGLKKGTDRFLKKVGEEPVHRALNQTVAEWAAQFEKTAYIKPETLFVFDQQILSARTEYVQLQQKFQNLEVPSKELWHTVFMEQWRLIRDKYEGSHEDLQAFFQLPESEVSVAFDDLADRVVKVCNQDESLFKEFVRDCFNTILQNLNQPHNENIDGTLDEISKLNTEGELQASIAIAQRLWNHHQDKMSPRQKYRTKAMIGHAYDWQDNYKKAAELFLEAKTYDPEYEGARAREAVAYIYLGNSKKAHEITTKLMQEFPEEKFGRAIWVRSMPAGKKFEEIEQLVPEHQRNDPEVAMALAERAIIEGNYPGAEKYINLAKKEVDNSVRIDEPFGDLLAKKARMYDQVIYGKVSTNEERQDLEKALELYTKSLKVWERRKNTKSVVRLRTKRAQIYLALSNTKKYEDDVTTAYNLNNQDLQAAFQYAGMKADRGELDEAVDIFSAIAQKASPTVEFSLAQELIKRNKKDDQEKAIVFLRSRLDGLKEMPLDFRVEYIALLLFLEIKNIDLDSAIRTLNQLNTDILTEDMFLVLESEAYRIGKDKEKAVEIAKKIMEHENSGLSTEEKRRIAVILQSLGLYQQALSFWQQIVSPDFLSRDLFNLLECADRCDEAKVIFEFCDNLRSNSLWAQNVFEKEIFYRYKYNDLKKLKQILADFIAQPIDLSYLSIAKYHMSTLAALKGENDLIVTNLDELPEVKEVTPDMGKNIVFFLTAAGETEKALWFSYELIRGNWDSEPAHLAMLSLLLPTQETVVSYKKFEIVAIATAVLYQEDDTKKKKWHIIEDSDCWDIDKNRNEYSQEHPYSVNMLNKKIGEQFCLRKGWIQDKTAKIIAILDKYEYRLGDCYRYFSERFPNSNALQEITVMKEDGQIDLDVLDKMLQPRKHKGEELLERYKAKQLTMRCFAKLMGKDLFDTIRCFSQCDDFKFFCRNGNNEENINAYDALNSVEEIVFDEVSLITLMLSDNYDSLLKMPFKKIVSEGVLQNLKEIDILKTNPEYPGGSIAKDGDRFCMSLSTSEDVRLVQKKVKDFIKFIGSNFCIESGIILSEVEQNIRELNIKLFGRSGAESMVLSSRPNRALWTDDLMCREVSKKDFGCKCVSTQQVFEYYSVNKVIGHQKYYEITLDLLSWGYYFTSINIGCALFSVDKSDGDVEKSPLRDVLKHFGDENILPKNVYKLSAGFIKGIWQKEILGNKSMQITLRMLEILSKRKGGMEIIKALYDSIERIFFIDIHTARQVQDVFDGWLMGGISHKIILP